MSAAVASCVLPDESPRPSGALRVLTLTPFFPSLQQPSQGSFIADPIDYLRDLGIASRTVAVNPFYRQAQDTCLTQSEWAKYRCVPGNLGLSTSGGFLANAIRRKVLQLHADSPFALLHAHAALPCGEAARILSEELGVPFVVSVHGLDVFAMKQAGRLLGLWTRRRSLQVYQRAARVICISRKVSEAISRDVQANTCVVYNAVDADKFCPAARDASVLRVLSVGNLIPTKGHAMLLRAFARVVKDLPNAELEIIGDGPESKRLKVLANRLGIASRTFFRGRQDRKAVAAAMQDCTVFALPSTYEGLGCVYLEAMACGKAAIGCFGQGIDEIIHDGENGRLVAPGDEVGLANALLALLQDSTLREGLANAARHTILSRHTLRHQARQLADLYQECTS